MATDLSRNLTRKSPPNIARRSCQLAAGTYALVMTKPTLMLDVDGVLVTGRPKDGAFWAVDLQADLGIDPGALQSVFFRPYWADVVEGRSDLMETLTQALPKLGTQIAPEAFVDYWFRNDARIDEGVLSDCQSLRAHGHCVFLTTNQDHLRAQYLMERLGFKDHVDGIRYSAALGVRKPKPAFYEGAAAGIDAPFLVDDTLANVEAAQAAGWQAAHWTGRDSLADLIGV